MKLVPLLVSAGLAAVVASAASADLLFWHGIENRSRYNPQANAALPGGFTVPGTIAFTNALFNTNSSMVNIDSLTFGIRRLAGASAVDIHFFAAQMDTNGDFIAGSMVDLGLQSLAMNAGGSVTELVSLNNLGLPMQLNDLAGSGNPGFAGLFFGLRFEGAGAGDVNNGWRVTDVPAVGSAFNFFAAYDPTVPVLDYFEFQAPTPSYFYLDINGSFIPAPGALALLGVAGLMGRRRRR